MSFAAPSIEVHGPPYRVLVVDDSQEVGELLAHYLRRAAYAVERVEDGLTALEAVKVNPPDLILLDVMMPHLDGYQVCRRLKSQPETRLIPVVMVTALTDLQDKVKAIEAGADDFLTKPAHKVELLARVGSLVRVKRLNDELESMDNVIRALMRAIEAKDPLSEGHAERVAAWAGKLGARIGLDGEDQRHLWRAGLLHDIGKIGVRDAILHKDASLTGDEFEEIKAHPLIAERIIEPLQSARILIESVRYHHERMDGRGYPEGLKGEAIPAGARIISILDAYDALVTDRPYRQALQPQEAFRVLREGAGSRWDPALVEAFIVLVQEESGGLGQGPQAGQGAQVGQRSSRAAERKARR